MNGTKRKLLRGTCRPNGDTSPFESIQNGTRNSEASSRNIEDPTGNRSSRDIDRGRGVKPSGQLTSDPQN